MGTNPARKWYRVELRQRPAYPQECRGMPAEIARCADADAMMSDICIDIGGWAASSEQPQSCRKLRPVDQGPSFITQGIDRSNSAIKSCLNGTVNYRTISRR